MASEILRSEPVLRECARRCIPGFLIGKQSHPCAIVCTFRVGNEINLEMREV